MKAFAEIKLYHLLQQINCHQWSFCATLLPVMTYEQNEDQLPVLTFGTELGLSICLTVM